MAEHPKEAPVGRATMSPAMADLRSYPRYLYDQVTPCLANRVWEIGVGYGTYTTWLREAGKAVLATDIDIECLRAAREKFVSDPGVETARVDLTDRSTIEECARFRADSILCLNVLEHIEDDVTALRWAREVVQPGGSLALIVPAHQVLFGRMDAEAGHFRRYTRRSLARVLTQAGWEITRLRYLNLLGAAGWWYHNRWRTNVGLADDQLNRQMRGVDRWLPRIARVTDPLFGGIAGLSVLAWAKAGTVGNVDRIHTIPHRAIS
jgi:2-polyprenyl-3-methyl-5-hydroxy-6-metoxy-1,4-benzoquinol methylase